MTALVAAVCAIGAFLAARRALVLEAQAHTARWFAELVEESGFAARSVGIRWDALGAADRSIAAWLIAFCLTVAVLFCGAVEALS